MRKVAVAFISALLLATPALAQKGGASPGDGGVVRGDGYSAGTSQGALPGAGASSGAGSTQSSGRSDGGVIRGGADDDTVLSFSREDAEMNAAIAAAQRTYPQFLADFRAASAAVSGNYMVKVALPTVSGSVEHIWVDNLSWVSGRLHGRLANHPVDLGDLRFGADVEIEAERVSDWAIRSTDGMYGSFTTRVMIERMSPAAAAPYRETLAPTPIPPGWLT